MTRTSAPDFLVVGGHKCGTTSLHEMLDTHPEISMSDPKEPHYWVRQECVERLHSGIWERHQYDNIWGQSELVCGESSVLYLAFADLCCKNLASELGQIPKIVVVVRDPISRAVSSYHDIRLKNPAETAPTVDAAIERELREPRELSGVGSPTLHHVALGFYADGVRRFIDFAGPDRVHVALFEEVVADHGGGLAKIVEFLGLPPFAEGDVRQEHRNRGGMKWREGPASALLRSRSAVVARRILRDRAPSLHHRLAAVATEHLTEAPHQISARLHERLVEVYSEDVAELQQLTGLDLSHWLQMPS